MQDLAALPQSGDFHFGYLKGRHDGMDLSHGSLPTASSTSLLENMSSTSSNHSSGHMHNQHGPSNFLHNTEESECLYNMLIGSGDAPMLFGWWSSARGWNRPELVERTTRCLPAVRPGLDLVALPQLPEVEELFSCWSKQHLVAEWQAIWFAPRLDPSCEHTKFVKHPVTVCREVFAKIPARVCFDKLCFYPMYLPADIQEVAETYGVRIVGDSAKHSLGPLCSAKAWLHPHICLEKRTSSLRDCGIESSGARGPRGYIASSTDDLLQAFRMLTAEMPCGTRFVLKPSWASGGEGIIIGVTEEQLERFRFPSGDEYTAILEELIEGLEELQSPTLYMIGGEACGPLADQVLKDGGSVNDGNRWPSTLPDSMTQTCIRAAKALQQVWGLSCQWGLDFVLDRQGAPIIVDLNMGRPNGNFAVRLWESRCCQLLFLHTSSWLVPPGLKAEELYKVLECAGVLWNKDSLQGVIVYQHIPGEASSFVVASADSWATVDALLVQFMDITMELTKQNECVAGTS
eukprot:TRINITY_DN3096_c0_g1_i3.p1 TRINITY_DN3096_c0_g1~~TRINITY_DN3096_c0_g1_i3.p1  ORF type:complete len:517 (-),score=108.28 TRINITY_DN3096_c0_g1_i3:428-1978(-)